MDAKRYKEARRQLKCLKDSYANSAIEGMPFTAEEKKFMDMVKRGLNAEQALMEKIGDLIDKC